MNNQDFLHIQMWANLLFAIIFTLIFMEGNDWKFIAYVPWAVSALLYLISVVKE